MMEHITFISAGAGSGKTYRLAADLERTLTLDQPARPSGVIGTTFTKLAAGELRERVRQRLNERGFSRVANQMDQAMLGTVNSICGRLLERFAFEAGLSPRLKVIEEKESDHLFNLALEQVLDVQLTRKMNGLAKRLGQDDWKNVVKAIVYTARSNNQSCESIRDSGRHSADSLLAFFPEASAKDLDKELLQAAEAAIEHIKGGDDQTKTTGKYLSLLQGSIGSIKQCNLAWSDWVKLSKEKTGARSLAASGAVQRVAGDFERHPRLRQDIQEYCENLFNIAAEALAHFQQFKKVRGLIDFTDQEQLLYETLSDPHVQVVLKDELDLLMVDEFQDTSPIQLALFLRLAALAKQVIWVGDVKQAIYGFRGSDPELMHAILRHLEANGGKTEVLETSWRSRSELVNYVNEIFVPAFADTLSAKRVTLQPKPASKTTDCNAVEYWQTEGSNIEKRSLALAKGLQEFIADDYRLDDKNSGQVRTATYGDVAVLCRTHDNLEKVAQALTAFAIPISRSQTGLLKTPEAALVLAAMRYLIDPQDSLATAEIICLTQGNAPEVWLQLRLEYIAKRDEEQQGQWGDDVALLQDLLKQRQRMQYLTPVEVMSQAINSADIRRVILSWQAEIELGKQRLLNVDKLLKFAEDYQEQCGNEGSVATVTGLLLWLEQLAKNKEDNQAANADRNAVQLLTHHGAKGLEWPVVIAMDLGSNIKNNLWGLSVREDRDELDITQPLAGRRLQYWLWSFGQQSTGISLKDRVEQSPDGVAAQERAVREAKRLLYVSLTRPRDCLIIPLKERKGEWLECLNADWMLPDEKGGNNMVLPASRQAIPATCKVITQDESPELISGQNASVHWFPVNSPISPKLPARFLPSKALALDQGKVLESVVLGDRISLQGTPEMANLGEAIHALISTQLINNPDQPSELAERVLDSYGVSEHISIDDALICVSRFKDFIERQFKPTNIHVEYPIEYQLSSGQSASGWVDLLIETDEGYIIIDHKSNPQSRKEWETGALKYSGQLDFYKKAVESVTSKPVLGCWVHFAVTGGMLRLF